MTGHPGVQIAVGVTDDGLSMIGSRSLSHTDAYKHDVSPVMGTQSHPNTLGRDDWLSGEYDPVLACGT